MVVPQALRGDTDANGADEAEEEAENVSDVSSVQVICLLPLPTSCSQEPLLLYFQQNGQSQQGNQRGPKQYGQRPQYDVKGGPKGQGQSHEVVRNRQFKTQHKSRGANHNRKAGSRAKMSRGMF